VDGPDGPSLPSIKGVTKASTAPLWVTYGVKAVLRDLPGATVVVEDTMPDILPQDLTSRSFFSGSLRFHGGEQLPDRRVVPLPDWMNPNVIMAGPNVIQRNYDLLGVRF
jgi:hypothetical protein